MEKLPESATIWKKESHCLELLLVWVKLATNNLLTVKFSQISRYFKTTETHLMKSYQNYFQRSLDAHWKHGELGKKQIPMDRKKMPPSDANRCLESRFVGNFWFTLENCVSGHDLARLMSFRTAQVKTHTKKIILTLKVSPYFHFSEYLTNSGRNFAKKINDS